MLDDLRDRYGVWPAVAAAVTLVLVVGFGVRALTTGGEADPEPTASSSPGAPATTGAPGGPTTTMEPDRIAVAETPAVPPGAFTNDAGTYFSTFSAPAETMAWMGSDALLFNRPLPADTPSVPESGAIASRIDDIIRGERLYDYGSGIEDDINSPAVLLVDSDAEDFTEVRFRPDVCGDDTWWNWTAAEFEPYINGAYANIGRYGIPVPDDFAMSPDDDDLHLVVYDWRRDVLIELWKTRPSGLTGEPGIEACWGGIVRHYAESGTGIYPFPMGVFAAGTTAPGLTITLADLEQGEIRHAIAVSADIGIDNQDQQSMSWPANRNDGNCSEARAADDDYVRTVTEAMDGEANCIYEGQFLRLPPDYDVDALTHPYARMLARAIRDYGMVLVDKAGCFCPQAESGLTPSLNGLADGSPWDDFFAGTPDYEVLWQIDWTQLQVLPPNWGRPDGYQIACSGPVNAAAEANPMAGDPRCQLPTAPYATG